MPNPTAKYIVTFDGHQLPGYGQSEDLPISSRDSALDILNRDGGILLSNGVTFRPIQFSFDVLTRLSVNSTGLQHLGDCMEQYRDVLRYVTRVPSSSTLFIGNNAMHYLIAKFSKISAPLTAPDHRRIRYNLDFIASPWFYGPTVSSSDSIAGDDTIVLNMTDTRKTYPIFEVPTGITRMSVSHTPSGKAFTFSGSHANTTTIDCGRLTVVDSAGANQVVKIVTGPDFGIYHTGSGSATFDISNVVGSGTVVTYMTPRLER